MKQQQRNLNIALTIVNIVLAIVIFLMSFSTYMSIQQLKTNSYDDIEPLTDGAYDHIGPLNDGTMVVTKNHKHGLIKNGGEIIVEPKYDYISSLTGDNGTRTFKENDLYGYLDKSGNIIIEPQFENASEFYDGKAKVREGVNVYYIDIHGKVIGTAE